MQTRFYTLFDLAGLQFEYATLAVSVFCLISSYIFNDASENFFNRSSTLVRLVCMQLKLDGAHSVFPSSGPSDPPLFPSQGLCFHCDSAWCSVRSYRSDKKLLIASLSSLDGSSLIPVAHSRSKENMGGVSNCRRYLERSGGWMMQCWSQPLRAST